MNIKNKATEVAAKATEVAHKVKTQAPIVGRRALHELDRGEEYLTRPNKTTPIVLNSLLLIGVGVLCALLARPNAMGLAMAIVVGGAFWIRSVFVTRRRDRRLKETIESPQETLDRLREETARADHFARVTSMAAGVAVSDAVKKHEELASEKIQESVAGIVEEAQQSVAGLEEGAAAAGQDTGEFNPKNLPVEVKDSVEFPKEHRFPGGFGSLGSGPLPVG